MIEIYLLEQLSAFRRCGTLSAAAEELLISQPALSRSMKKLEDELQVPLFDRTKNKLTLNENGEMAADYADQILRQENDMVEKIRAFDRSKRTISVGTAGPGPIYELIPLINELYPGVETSSCVQHEDRLIEGLNDHEYQIIVLPHEMKGTDYYCRYWGDEQLYISVPPANPIAAYKDGIHFADVNGQTFLQYSDVGVWNEIKKKYLSKSNIIYQNEIGNLNTLIDNSALPGFATNVTLRSIRRNEQNRVYIPFLDPQATVHFYCICLRSEAPRFEKLFNTFKNNQKH